MKEKYKKWMAKHAHTLAGKRVVVTGANSGVGFAAAEEFLALGARVTLACRNPERARAAREKLIARYPAGEVDTETVDLSSFASIDAFAARLKETGASIDIFLHCAGVYFPKEPLTEDGYPMTVGVNYVGTVRLSRAVEPLIPSDGKMIFTTSLTDRFGKPMKQPKKETDAAYAASKTLLSAYVLRRAAERRAGEPSFLAVHPGITATNLLSPEKTTRKPWFFRLGHAFLFLFTHSPEKAALTAILAGAGNGENGDIIGPRGPFGISGYPHKTRFCRNVRRTAEHFPDEDLTLMLSRE
ncbi:MAG: SDR family NAD(P)-dependent oxidoreductase [Eubacteriales bacterium]